MVVFVIQSTMPVCIYTMVRYHVGVYCGVPVHATWLSASTGCLDHKWCGLYYLWLDWVVGLMSAAPDMIVLKYMYSGPLRSRK